MYEPFLTEKWHLKSTTGPKHHLTLFLGSHCCMSKCALDEMHRALGLLQKNTMPLHSSHLKLLENPLNLGDERERETGSKGDQLSGTCISNLKTSAFFQTFF